MVKVESLDYKPKPIDENFLEDAEHYPVTGKHHDHEVRAEGVQRMDAEGKPYPTKHGIHGSKVAIDWVVFRILQEVLIYRLRFVIQRLYFDHLITVS